MTPADIIAAIQARGSDAMDLRDAAHEAHHALVLGVPVGKWDRKTIDCYAQRAIRKNGRGFGLADETMARAVEQLVCADFGVDCGTVERCALVASMEAIKFDRVSYDLGMFVRTVKAHMVSPEARQSANAVIGLASAPAAAKRRRRAA